MLPIIFIIVVALFTQPEKGYWICAEPLQEEKDGSLVCELEYISPNQK